MELRLKALSDKDIETVYNAALCVLDRTGSIIESQDAVELLCKAGAHIDRSHRVHIPPKLVEQALAWAPKTVKMYDRLGNPAKALGEDKSYFSAHQTCPQTLDLLTGALKPTTLDYCEKSSRVIDALPNIDSMGSGDFAADVVPEYADAALFAAAIRNTSKPVSFAIQSLRSGAMILDMAAAAVGGLDRLKEQPFIIICDSPVSPLYHPKGPVEKLMWAAKLGLPVNYNPMPQGGLTAPTTLAGVLVMTLAELFAGLVIFELVNPGTPFTCGGVPSVFDMRDTTFVYGSPELFLMCSALTDIVHHYHLPSLGTAGMTNAKKLDLQAAVDASLSSLMAVLSRSNYVHDIGIIDVAAHSLELVVLTDEIVGMIRLIEKGIEVNPETLALDVIDKVGPQGTFIAEEHTLKHFRECWHPRIFDHSPRGTEIRDNLIVHRLQQRIDDILESHRPAELPREASAMIASYAELWTLRK